MIFGREETTAKELYKELTRTCGSDALRAALGMKPKSLRSIIRGCRPLGNGSRHEDGGGYGFLGGSLVVEEGVARAVPHSWRSGRTVSALVLSEMLRGLYPKEFSTQGDLLWKSFLMRKARAEEILSNVDVEDEALAEEAALRSTKLWPLMAIMTAEDVTESYASLGGPLYLDHVTEGRLKVENFLFDDEDLERLTTFIEADFSSGYREGDPLYEVDLQLGPYRFRIAVDLPPVARGTVDVRSLSAMSSLSLPRLISLGTITEVEAATILDYLMSGKPVLIFGKTGAGKTTLSNAILASLPRDIRIVSVEEVREIEDLSAYGMHHFPYELGHGNFERLSFLLHRNPDLVFLGEILSSDHAAAFSMAHHSGLKVMATTHGAGFKQLSARWDMWREALPMGTLAVLMEGKTVMGIMEWDGAWFEPEHPDSDWLGYIMNLRGARSNEEVRRRLDEVLVGGQGLG